MGQRQSKLAPRTLAELRNQINFSVEELQEWYKEFKASWPKGFLTEDEFKGVYSNIFPLGDATEFARHVFRVFDQNKDGLLDFREFMCGFSVVLLGSLEEKLKFSFNIYDIDGNGFISRNEMFAILSVRSFCNTGRKKDFIHCVVLILLFIEALLVASFKTKIKTVFILY